MQQTDTRIHISSSPRATISCSIMQVQDPCASYLCSAASGASTRTSARINLAKKRVQTAGDLHIAYDTFAHQLGMVTAYTHLMQVHITCTTNAPKTHRDSLVTKIPGSKPSSMKARQPWCAAAASHLASARVRCCRAGRTRPTLLQY
jgi:hypothetical protein